MYLKIEVGMPRSRTVVGPWAKEYPSQKTTDKVRVPYQECKPRGGHFRLALFFMAVFGTRLLDWLSFCETSAKSIHNSTASCQRQKNAGGL